MRKILWAILAVVIVLLAVILVNTLTFRGKNFAHNVEPVSAKADPAILGEAVTYQTISHKKEMIDRETFAGFHEFMSRSFPLMDSLLQKEVVNEFSLMYTWQGSDENLQPVVLMAHQDVVPAEYSSLHQWHYPPFSGEVTEEFIYGRGTLDDKGSMIAICQSVEGLLAEGRRPERSIYFCFGHDEEIGGEAGAKVMAQRLEQKGVAAWMVLDEGGTLARGIVPGIEQTVALIGTSEKGYVSLELLVDLPGGHSSMPEDRTALGVLNKAIYRLQDNPMPNRIAEPVQGFVEHIGPHMPFVQKMAFANPWLFKPLIFSAYEKSASGAAMIHTTQVPTIFSSGLKDNIIPTRAKAVVNYRLLPGDSPEGILERAKEVVADTAVKIRIHEHFSVPASPISDHASEQFGFLAAVVKAVNQDVLVSPYLVLGATDSRYFYSISDHVFRFSPIPLTKEDLPRIHGLNERISIEGYEKSVEFYTTLLVNL